MPTYPIFPDWHRQFRSFFICFCYLWGTEWRKIMFWVCPKKEFYYNNKCLLFFTTPCTGITALCSHFSNLCDSLWNTMCDKKHKLSVHVGSGRNIEARLDAQMFSFYTHNTCFLGGHCIYLHEFPGDSHYLNHNHYMSNQSHYPNQTMSLHVNHYI